MPHRLTLLTVHAHPDDETITTGGVMARYAAEGLRVVCVTCTGGELGEIVVPEMDTAENHARLGEIRAVEMAAALAALSPEGRIEHRWLGYRDSGMMDTDGNADPRAFWKADLAEATERLAVILRDVEPDVVVGYNDFGGYGHPDHIRAALTAKAAFEAVNGPMGPTKLYETVLDWSRLEAIQHELAERGIESAWAPSAEETPEQRAEREAWTARMAAATGPVTTRVDVTDYLEHKIGALRAHVTQISATNPFLALGAEAWKRYQPTEDFTLRVARIGVRLPETDLFAGLR
ncbi:MAG: PIG-L family deacetylase [Candidatus Limnocylindrales bacterium]